MPLWSQWTPPRPPEDQRQRCTGGADESKGACSDQCLTRVGAWQRGPMCVISHGGRWFGLCVWPPLSCPPKGVMWALGIGSSTQREAAAGL